MTPGFRQFLNFLERLPKPYLWAIVLFLTLFIGCVDYWTGPDISLRLFYLIPLSLAAWCISRTAANIVAAIIAFIWIFSNDLPALELHNPLLLVWEVSTRFGFLLVVSYLLAELRQLLEHERLLARTDFLTGVLNRRAFFDRIELEILRSNRCKDPLTVLYIDLDNFKTVNDQMGHNTGDSVLQTVAQSILQSIRTIDAIARLGGDEFAVLLPETNETAAQVIAPRIQRALLWAMDDHHWPITFSIGALTCLQPLANGEELLRFADRLMYDVKKNHKNAIRYAVYPDASNA